jgi:nickel/cobalt exporter
VSRLSVAILALVALAAGAIFAPSAALAHPLGNFTTNQLLQVRIGTESAQLSYVFDLAEIPTFQQLQSHDTDDSGELEGREREALIASLLPEIESGVTIAADGERIPLGRPHVTGLTFPPGQGGLSLTRLELGFESRLPRAVDELEVTNEAFAARTGWRAIQVLPGEGTAVRSSVPATDPTDGLRSYPSGLLDSPPDDRRASFAVSEGNGTVSAPEGVVGGEPVEDRSGDGFAEALAGGRTDGLLILLLLGAAFGWGALHALSPGHGKAMVAGYLADARGTPRHALALGLTITVTHTAAVFALGLIVLSASEYLLPERLYPWLSLASGVLVVAIGLSVMRSRLQRWRALRADGWRGADHHHHEPITARGLLGLGISGGIVPCPSALVVLIAAISQHRVGLGMLLILAFSLGLAAAVTAVGLIVIWGGRLVERLRPEQRLFGGRLIGVLPALSAIVIVAAGLLITSRAIPELG